MYPNLSLKWVRGYYVLKTNKLRRSARDYDDHDNVVVVAAALAGHREKFSDFLHNFCCHILTASRIERLRSCVQNVQIRSLDKLEGFALWLNAAAVN